MELLYGIYYCQSFILYLAIVPFCGCQWPMSNSFLTAIRKDVKDHGSSAKEGWLQIRENECGIHHHHHHHHVVRPARISLTLSLSLHVSLSFITSGRSSGLHPVSSHSCCMYVRAGCPTFNWPYAGVHRSTSLTSSSLLLQQCSACLVRLAWIVFVIGGRWPYSWCLVGCYCQDLFNIALNILV